MCHFEMSKEIILDRNSIFTNVVRITVCLVPMVLGSRHTE